MNNLCITTVVDSRYWDYVELFTWCVNKNYPEYEVKILRKEEVFPDYPDRGYTTNALRMVVPPSYYDGFDYVYITDIDILILRETTPLLDFHIADMSQGFSNSIRGQSNKFATSDSTWDGTQCLSGLHFCTPEWFEKVEPFAKEYREILKTKEVGRGYDGRMLYLMCKAAGLTIPPKKKLIKRHHGIHIGTFRLWDEGLPYINRPGANPMTKEKADSCISKRVSDLKIMKWLEMMNDPEYEKILGRIKNQTVLGYIKKLEGYCRARIH